MSFYLLAPKELEGPYATIDDARGAQRGRGLDIAESTPAPGGDGVRFVGLRIVPSEIAPGMRVVEFGRENQECEACAGTGRYGFRDDDECPKCHGGGVVS